MKALSGLEDYHRQVLIRITFHAAAKTQDLHDRIGRQREQHDVKRAEWEAENAEADAADALDYASWAVEQAQLAVLDAIDARGWADARAAAAQ